MLRCIDLCITIVILVVVSVANSRGQPLPTGPVSQVCLDCICQGTSNCTAMPCAVRNGKFTCGYYNLQRAFWIDCGSPGAPAMDFMDCVMDRACSDICIQNYMRKYGNYCPGIHPCQRITYTFKGGPWGCNGGDTAGIVEPFWTGVQTCLANTPGTGVPHPITETCSKVSGGCCTGCQNDPGNGVVKRLPGLTNNCLKCMLQAHSGCEPVFCSNATFGQQCGYYHLTNEYYGECGTPAGVGFDRRQDCADDRACADTCVVNYLDRYAAICAGATEITCETYARVHFGGPLACRENLQNFKDVIDAFWARVLKCLGG